MNYDGLKDNITCMLAGAHCKVEPRGFWNDLPLIKTRNDVLTALIHLSYLSYNRDTKEHTCQIEMTSDK